MQFLNLIIILYQLMVGHNIPHKMFHLTRQWGIFGKVVEGGLQKLIFSVNHLKNFLDEFVAHRCICENNYLSDVQI